MKLGEWLKMYRARHSMTMQDLANACGLNPTTGKSVSPTMQTLDK